MGFQQRRSGRAFFDIIKKDFFERGQKYAIPKSLNLGTSDSNRPEEWKAKERGAKGITNSL
jgi:hypothetical protein